MSFKKQLVLLTKMDPELLEFRLPANKKENDKGPKFFNMFYKNKLINIQLPKLIAPFGISGYTDKVSGETSYSINLELPENTKAYNILKEIQAKALGFVVTNSEYFYKNKKDRENVTAFGKEFIKENEDSEYPGSFSIKMKFDKNNLDNFDAKADIITTVEDEEPLVEENQILNVDTALEYITKRCEVQAVINAYGYQVDTKYGLSLKAEKLRVFTTGNNADTFLEESENEIEVESENEVEVEVPVLIETSAIKKSRKKKEIEVS